MNRAIAFLSSVVALMAIPSAGEAESTDSTGPNVVLMMADDLGDNDLGVYGDNEARTPALDQLAEEKMRFTDFYAGTAVCSPSQAAFLTGRFSVRAGVYSWIHSSHQMHLRVEETTIAEIL